MRKTIRSGFLLVFAAASYLGCSGGDASLNPPQTDLLACKISIDRSEFSFGDRIEVNFGRNQAYKPPSGFKAIPCQSIGLGSGKIQLLESSEVVHEFDLGMVRIGGVPFTHGVTIKKYQLMSKGGSFGVRASNNDWISNTVQIELH